MSLDGSEHRQDMPPKGGYRKFNFDRTFPKIIWRPGVVVAIGVGVGIVGYIQTTYKQKGRRTEKFIDVDEHNAMRPFLKAERDRQWLLMLKQNRAMEAEVMKDVPGWVVGTWYGEPVYLTLGDKWWDPIPPETTHHAWSDIWGGDAMEREVMWRHTETYAGPHFWDKWMPEWLSKRVY